MIKPSIDYRSASIGGALKALLAPATKKVVTDALCGGAWVNQTPRQLSRTGVDRSTLCDVCNTVSVKNTPSLVMIGSVNNSPPCGFSRSLQVAKKRKSTSPGLVENTHKLDAVVYRSLSNDLDSESIFSKVIDHKLYNGSSNDLYSHCRMNFVNDPVQTQAPHFMYMRLPAISTLNESGVLGTPDTRIRRPGASYT